GVKFKSLTTKSILCSIFPAELKELISYLQTKIRKVDVGEVDHATDIDQWEWLLNVLSDPLLAKAFLMHDCLAIAYEKCRQKLKPEPRDRWPVLPGLAYDVLEAVQNQLIDTLQQPIQLDAYTINHISNLHNILCKPMIRNLLLAMDGLANTWLFEANTPSQDHPEEKGPNASEEPSESPMPVDPTIEYSVVPGCYATLAYDENGRDSYSEQGVRLKYVVFQKGDNEFLGATVRCERRSILIARIINGGLAQKTNLLHEGDELIAANGIELLGKDLNTVTDTLASLRGRVILLVAPATDPYAKAPMGGIIHLRALFSYEPMEDRYLACHELGLAFTKGDIIHVTGRRDPNWWQAYRSDEETGLTGAVGTLAGLIPSPIYQRQRAILQLQSLLNSGAEDIELEEEPSDLELDRDQREGKENATNIETKGKSFLGIKFSFSKYRGDKRDKTQNSLTGSAVDLRKDPQDTRDSNETEATTEQTNYVINSALVSSIYAGRMSGHDRPTGQPSEGAIEEWSAAGPVWGQHGFDMRPRRGRRRKHTRKQSSRTSPCMDGIRGKKKLLYEKDYFPSLAPVPDSALLSADDPVAWLDKEVSRGFLRHHSLWTYEPVAQYIPQPLRRRPLVFVGPAHVGRHQLMQRLIQVDPNRFCPAPIHTTNPNMQSDTSVPYICVSEETFEADRKRGEFVEWGVFNRARYGTSRSTLRKLIEEGKVCCISLRPDSLRLMRASGLLPYVIFISPPERVDEFRRVQKQLGLKAACSDLELKSCIDISRKMELRYGHWFDIVIVPETLEETVEELSSIATQLEREPSWVPRYWL
ncbi:MAGUK p55 subfamily member 5, partial [Paragonimus heterotremus]